MNHKHISTVLACALAAWIMSSATQADGLPVRKVIMYKNGIAYVERAGKVDGTGEVTLTMRTEYMKDALKSMFATCEGSGRITRIVYQGQDPQLHQAKEIKLDLPPSETLSRFLMSIQGTRVDLSRGDGKHIDATILGIEKKRRKVRDGETVEERYIVYRKADGTIERCLLQGTSIRILDKEIARELDQLLYARREARYVKYRKIEIGYEGAKGAVLRVGYVTPAPVWKTTYRIFLDARPRPLLEIYAVVENDTPEDWKDVDITLANAGPFSYVVDMYTPIHPSRPVLAAADVFGLPAGRLPAGFKAKGGAPGISRRSLLKAAVPMEAVREEKANRAYLFDDAVSLAKRITRGMKAAAETVRLGAYFSYHVSHPVSIERGRAALLNVLSHDVDGEKLVYYDGAAGSNGVLNAFLFKNTTGTTLDKGFVTFFEGSGTVGEGVLAKPVPTGTKALVTYGAAGEIEVEPKRKHDRSSYVSVTVSGGMMVARRYEYARTTYSVFNKAKKDKVLLIDHPVTAGMELVEPTSGVERLSGVYRLRMRVAGGAHEKATVTERRLVHETIRLDVADLETIRVILSGRAADEATRELLRKAVALLEKMSNNATRMKTLEKRNRYLKRQMEMVRKNMSALYRGSPEESKLRAKLVAKMEKYSDEYMRNEDERAALDKENSLLKARLRKMLKEHEGKRRR